MSLKMNRHCFRKWFHYPQPPSARRLLSLVIPSISSSVRLSVCPEWHSHSNSLRISAISLKFDGMMHSTMEQIAFQNGHTRPIFACSIELFKGFSYWPEIFVRWCTVTWSILLYKMAMLGQLLRVPRNFEIFHDRLFWPGHRDEVIALTI